MLPEKSSLGTPRDWLDRARSNLAPLLPLLEQEGIFLPEAIRAAADLTDYAVTTRYPGTAEPVKEEEFQQALQTAEGVFSWAEKLVAPAG